MYLNTRSSLWRKYITQVVAQSYIALFNTFDYNNNIN
jgi:hypothetical protein